MMNTKEERNLPDQGDRTPRSRREGGMVPATPSSLSDDGFLVPCTPGGAGNTTTGCDKTSQADSDVPGTPAGSQEGGTWKQRSGTRPGPRSSKVTRTTGDEKAARQTGDEEGADTRASSPIGSVRSTGTASTCAGSSESDVSVQTTISGTAKRLRRRGGQDIAPKKGRIGRSPRTSPRTSPRPSGALAPTSDEEMGTPEGKLSPETKRRGRPPTTGEGLMKTQRERARREVRQLQEQSLTLQRIMDGDFEPREERAERTRRKKEEELEREMRSLPPRDIAAQLVLAARRVEETASKSGNLKGGYARLLKDAALAIEVGVDALATRGAGTTAEAPSTSALRAEIRALSGEMKQLREENETLRQKLEELGRGGLQAPGPPSPPREVEMRSASSGGETPTMSGRRTGGSTAGIPPPRSKAGARDPFPALRPAIRGVRRNLDEPLGDPVVTRPSPPAPPTPPGPKSRGGITEDKLEERLREFQAAMLGEMRSLLGFATRARTPAPRKGGRTAAQPLPPPEREKGKGNKGRANNPPPRPAAAPRTSAARGRGKADAKPTDPTGQRTGEEWAKVVGRREKRAARPKPPPPPPPKRPAAAAKKTKRRVPRTSAVAITGPRGEATEVMARIRAKVPLASVGLTSKDVTTRRGVTGATIVEVGGPDHGAKADALAAAIRFHLAGGEVEVRIDRPTKTADVRVRGLEASVTPEEVASVLAEEGGCSVREVRTGDLRAAPRGANTLWARMPLASAKKAAAAGSIHVGWTRARVELLDVRPLRCYKCLERGHARAVCPNQTDRSGRCYRCSGTGHTAKGCVAPPKCPLCSELGRRAGHILGAPECAPIGRRGGRRAPAPVILPPTGGSTPRASGDVGLPPAEEGESPKPQRKGKRRTTRPLDEEPMETEGANTE